VGNPLAPLVRIKRKAAAVTRDMIGVHSMPVFEAAQSHHHRPASILDLRLRALRWRLSQRTLTGQTRTFLQFAGFPRSGHSLIGSLIDAHPEAIVSHELDTMGLVDKGWSRRNILALIASESAAFMEHGRYWNGFSYVVPKQFNGRADTPVLVGDKKGDWAVRRIESEPTLLDKLHRTMRMQCKWVLVVRNPFDNIATMSLRRGGAYDRLRISAPDGATFHKRLAAEKGRSVAEHADDDMIADFIGLCRGVASLQEQVAPENWLAIGYERFTQEPEAGLRPILSFLELEDRDGFVADAASIVREGGNRSRHSVAWSPGQIDRVREAIAEFDFLSLAEPGEPA